MSDKPQIGSLYTVDHSNCFLIAFPNQRMIKTAFYDGPWCSATSASSARALCLTVLNGRYNKVGEGIEPLFYLNPRDPFLLLERISYREACLPVPIWRVLYRERIGWINAGQYSFIVPFIQ